MKRIVLILIPFAFNTLCYSQVDTTLSGNEATDTNQATSFKKVRTVADYENVSITGVEIELKGLFKLGDVSSKSTRGTEKDYQRAYRKLKMAAAIMGANVVFLGTDFQPGYLGETKFNGVAYTNVLPDIEEFKTLVNGKSSFMAVEECVLFSFGTPDLIRNSMESTFYLDSISIESGMIMIHGNFEMSKYQAFRVVSFDNEYFYIYYVDASSNYYSLRMKI